jgi:hypothetical protein
MRVAQFEMKAPSESKAGAVISLKTTDVRYIFADRVPVPIPASLQNAIDSIDALFPVPIHKNSISGTADTLGVDHRRCEQKDDVEVYA